MFLPQSHMMYKLALYFHKCFCFFHDLSVQVIFVLFYHNVSIANTPIAYTDMNVTSHCIFLEKQ